MLPSEFVRVIELPQVIDKEFPPPGKAEATSCPNFDEEMLLPITAGQDRAAKKSIGCIAMKLTALPPWYCRFQYPDSEVVALQVAGKVVRHADLAWLEFEAPLEKIELFCRFRGVCYVSAYC